MKKNGIKKKVFVGLSGGVDSSVSAALLIKAGFDVIGVFIKVWQPDIKISGGCSWTEDRLDAMRVCAKLNIPFFTLNMEKEYKKEVVDYMIKGYRSGQTPNPDIMCNKYVKFGGFFNWAIKNGADYVATGHYAQVKKENNKFSLLAGNDTDKDQSYFLWTLTQKQLSRTLFPIGCLKKVQVRKLAKKFGLNTATKKDSQGLCFMGKINVFDFLKKYIKEKRGVVLNERNQVIGSHDGVQFYTLGQRHGFTINKKTHNEKRLFILSKSLKDNTLIVSDDIKKTEGTSNKVVMLENINWTFGVLPDLNKKYLARIRYRQRLEKCKLEVNDGRYKIVFQNIQKAPTPGQSVVIYDGGVCLGGGTIV